MARDSAEVHVERIPSIINDILLTRSLSRNDDSIVRVFDNIVGNLSRQNCADMPPLLLTEKDHLELQKDRENAIKYEELLTRRKQEQYFDLVDKVQNVLKRIEEKNSLKSDSFQSDEKQIYNSTHSLAGSLSDFNNNPSQEHPAETHIEDIESSSSPNLQRNFTSSNTGELLNWKRRPTQHQDKTGRYSLPANFETMYQSRPFPASAKSNSGIGGNDHYTSFNVQRPLSACSDHHMVFSDQGDRYFDGGCDGDIERVTNRDHQHLHGGTNGYVSGLEAFQQPWNPTPKYTNYQPSYAISPGTENYVRQPEKPQNTTNSTLKPGHCNTLNHSSIIDSSPILPHSSESQSSISKQREILALEQKCLEEHYAKLQNQLLADFQQRQEELIQVYNKSLETQSGGDQTMQSIFERSFESESENTIVQSSADVENFTLLQTDEFPQSPFGINVKKSSNSIQKSISPNLADKKSSSRSFQNSSPSNQRQRSSAYKNPTSFSGKLKKSVKSSQNSPSPTAGLVKSSNAFQESRFTKNSSGSQKTSHDQRFTGNLAYPIQNSFSPASSLQNSTPPPVARLARSSNASDERCKSTAWYSLQNSTSLNSGLARKSFNSEVSAQEYYDIPHFGDKSEKSEVVGKRQTVHRLEKDVGKGNGQNGTIGKDGKSSTNKFGANVVTSPKRTQLSSFESQAIRNLKNTQSRKFFMVSAHAKGFLTRLLFQTAKINVLITTVKDAKSVLAEMNSECSQSMTDRSFKERVKAQLHAAQSELRRIFVDSPPSVRMQILEQNRRLLQEKKDRNANKVHGTTHIRPKLSNVTVKKRLSRQENQLKTPKSDKGGTPNSSKVSPVVTKARSMPKSMTKNTSTTSRTKTAPKNKAKMEVSPESNPAVTDTAKGASPRIVTELITVPATFVTTDATITETNTTSASSEGVVQRSAVTKTSPVTTAVTTCTSTTSTRHDNVKSVKNKTSVKPVKASTKVTLDSKSKRRTWDTGVLKPIQGRISPTIPTDRTRSSNDKRQSALLSARKVGQKLLSEYQTNGVSGQSNTCEVSGIDVSKTYKINKSEQPVKKTGARRSLAANLSHK